MQNVVHRNPKKLPPRADQRKVRNPSEDAEESEDRRRKTKMKQVKRPRKPFFLPKKAAVKDIEKMFSNVPWDSVKKTEQLVDRGNIKVGAKVVVLPQAGSTDWFRPEATVIAVHPKAGVLQLEAWNKMQFTVCYDEVHVIGEGPGTL